VEPLALSETGKLEEAIAHIQQAAKLSGGRDPMILNFLGELYAKVGRVPEAVEVTRQAMAVAAQAKDSQLVAELQARIAAYESRR
jgi:Flp pilus assembly protein TadD